MIGMPGLAETAKGRSTHELIDQYPSLNYEDDDPGGDGEQVYLGFSRPGIGTRKYRKPAD